MRRPVPVTVTSVVGTLLAAALVIVTTCELLLTWQAPSREAFSGMLIGAGVLGAITLAIVMACVGLWMSRRWGWWLALATSALGLAIFVWGPIEDLTRPDPDELGFMVAFAVLVALCLLAPVRRYFVRSVGRG